MRSLLVFLFSLWAHAATARPLSIEFLDVGQGDAALVTAPSGKTVLVDAGPPEHARRVVARVKRLGKPLDLVILTHRHLDHLGGMAAAIDAVGARAFLDPAVEHPSPHYQALVAALERRHVPVRDAFAGRTIDLGDGVTLRLLGPPRVPIRGTRSDVNTNSVVARVDYGRTRVLLTGDSEAATERWLLGQAEGAAAVRADAVKVAHHGSRYSSTAAFVRAVGASLAVISVGAHNDHGHPAAGAVRRWEAAGARVLRTDRDGDITVVSDGVGLRVETERGTRRSFLCRAKEACRP